jgi:hypothetical protein
MIPRRRFLPLILALSVLAAACIKDAAKTLGELQSVRTEINKKFGEDVNIHLGTGASLTLTITFINSPLNEKTAEDRGKRAQETAQLVIANYKRIRSVREIWVGFVRQQTRFVFFHYSEGFEVYGFDNQGQRLAFPSGTENSTAAPAPDSRITAGYAASSGQTDVTTAATMQLDGMPGGYGLTVMPHFQLQGDARRRQVPAPNEAAFYFASYSKKPRFSEPVPIEFIADGTPVIQEKATFTGSDAQYCYFKVPYSVFRKLATAKNVAIKLGVKIYPLTPEQLELLQKMDGYVLQ